LKQGNAVLTVLRALTRLITCVCALAAAAALLLLLPWALVHFVGWPLPHTVPTWAQTSNALTHHVSPTLIIDVLACLVWLCWLNLTASFLIELIAALARTRAPHLPGLGPGQALAAALITMIGIGALATRPVTPAAPPTPHRNPVAAAPALALAADDSTPPARATASSSSATDVYTVTRGDSLYSIAKDSLGDGTKWPLIFQDNHHRAEPDGAELTTPNLIRPGWTLLVPPPPPPATSIATIPGNPAATPQPPSPPAATPHAPAPPTAHTPASAPAPSRTAPATPTPSTSSPTGTDPRPAAGHTPPARTTAHAPIDLATGGNVAFAFAIAVGAALALALRHHARRLNPATAAHTGTEPPLPTIRQLRRATLTATHPTAYTETDEDDDEALDVFGATAEPGPPLGEPEARAEPPAHHNISAPDHRVRIHDASPSLYTSDPATPSGIALAHRDGHPILLDPENGPLALTGPGALGAARALLAATLAPATAHHADAAGRAIITQRDLALLLETDDHTAATLGRALPDLTVTDTPAAALAAFDAENLYRARLLDEYEATSLAALRDLAPDTEDLPPLLLIGRTRLHHAAHAARHHLSLLTLGPADPEHTITVAGDGTAHAHTDHPLAGARLHTLAPEPLTEILSVLAAAADTRPLTAMAPAPDGDDDDRADFEPADGPATPDAHNPADQDPPEPTTGDQDQPPPLPDAEPESLPDTHPPAAGTRDQDGALADAHAPANPDHTDATPSEPAATTQTDITAPAQKQEPGINTLATPTSTVPAAGKPAATRVSVCVFGPLSLRIDHESITVGLRGSAWPILALLALRGQRGATADEIDTTLWPDHDPATAARQRADGLNSLRTTLSKRTGDRGHIPLDGARYRLHPGLVDVDLTRFKTFLAQAKRAGSEPETERALLEQALDAYRGPFLDTANSAAYEWAELHRRALGREALSTRARAAALADHAGDLTGALDHWEQARIHDPEVEDVYQQIMALQGRLGRTADVQATFDLLTANFAAFDQTPSTATKDLAATLLRGQPAPHHGPQTYE
jgi:DNA-binding SARP family transcriptional activator/LysM repeat protein